MVMMFQKMFYLLLSKPKNTKKVITLFAVKAKNFEDKKKTKKM